MVTFSRAQHIIYQSIILLIICLNTLYLNSNIISILIGIIYLAANTKKIADIFFKKYI